MAAKPVESWNTFLNVPLEKEDPEVFDIIEQEKIRQWSCLELIASENFTSQAVMEANGSPLTNKYSEGLPGSRYYGGNEYIDILERLTQKRALEAFELDPEKWGVNVQPYSGSTANFAAVMALLEPHERLMGLDLPSGGHLSHGYATPKKKVTASAIVWDSMPYRVDSETGYIDYDKLEENATLFRPKLIICGASAYPREFDYPRLRKIADINNSYLMADIAHISGLVAGKEAVSPFDYCDIVTTTTHKTLRGPRAGLIFYNKSCDKLPRIEAAVNGAVFPGAQGGPHNNTIAGIAVALKQAASPEWKAYAQQIRKNCAAMAAKLKSYGYKIVTDGTDNHLILWDLRPHKLTGSKMEKICDYVNITLNKNAVHGDRSAAVPGGCRVGAAALTSRSLKEADFEKIAEYLDRAAKIALRIQAKTGKMLKDFVAEVAKDEEVKALQKEVETFARSFPMPGFDPSKINLAKYTN